MAAATLVHARAAGAGPKAERAPNGSGIRMYSDRDPHSQRRYGSGDTAYDNKRGPGPCPPRVTEAA